MRITRISNISFGTQANNLKKPKEQNNQQFKNNKKELTPQEKLALENIEKRKKFEELINRPQKFSKKG